MIQNRLSIILLEIIAFLTIFGGFFMIGYWIGKKRAINTLRNKSKLSDDYTNIKDGIMEVEI